MTKNPILNASAALGYIALISTVMFYGSKFAKPEDTIIAPIVVLSLLSLSAAVMGYTFLYNPFVLYIEGKKKEGLDLFLKTVGIFGIITVILLLIMFSGVI